MKAIFVIGVIFWVSMPLPAQQPAAEVESALEAMETGIPEVAAVRLQGFLEAYPKAPEIPEVREYLVEALLLSSELEKARAEAALLRPGSSQAAWLRGRIAASEGNWDEACGLFQRVADESEEPEKQRAARVALAYCLTQSGEHAEAAEVLESLREADETSFNIRESLLLADIWITLERTEDAATMLNDLEVPEGSVAAIYQWIQARLAWHQGDAQAAAELLVSLVDRGPGITAGLLASAHLLRARALAETGETTSAASLLENFLEHHPESPYMSEAFAELDRIYAVRGSTSLDNLDRWTRVAPFDRRQHAVYYAAVQRIRAGRLFSAIHSLSTWVEAPEDVPLHEMGRLALAGAFLLNQEPLKAADQLAALERELLPEAELPRLIYLSGATAFELERYDEAVKHFSALRKMDLADDQPMVALYNLAQSHTAAGNYGSFLEAYKEFSEAYPENPLRRELVLEEGLLQARNGDARAQETLRLFVRDFDDHPRLPEAQLGLAELAYQAELPDLEGAAMWLAEIDRTNASPEVLEAADYLEIFIAGRRGESATGIEARVSAFLTTHEESGRAGDLLAKAGEKYFAEQNYLAAQGLFERAAGLASGPDSAKAYFLAGLAAVRTMNPQALDQALEYFESVVRLDGNLQLQARLEQARVKMRQGQFSDAVLLCQNALTAGPPAPLRYELMMAIAEAEAAAASGDGAAKPVAAFRALADAEGVPPLWRNQALWKAAQILERAGRREDALLAYYDAFAEDPMAEEVPDFFWFYKAAFDAARILEEDGKVESAVGVYRRLSILPGPRAAEATQRLNRLRLEHFLWEE